LSIVRVRIIRRLTGSVDGIDLRPFQPGAVYEVSTALGSYLLCVRVAEPAPDDSPTVGVPLGKVRSVADHVGLPPAHLAGEPTLATGSRNPRRTRPTKRR
jgi:hypothetical protein